MFARLVFTLFLLTSTVVVQYHDELRSDAASIAIVYILTAAIFVLSLFYISLSKRVTYLNLFASSQIGIDTFIVTLIIYSTGGLNSFFSFLYIVVVIYASMILFLRGGLFIALLSNLQYSILLVLQYLSILDPIGINETITSNGVGPMQLVLKIMLMLVACMAVAVLSGLLMEQNKETQKELRSMELHIKRVEKLAYMGEMAAGLAHEIRNPLASLVGSIQMLKEELPYNTDHQRLMDIVYREADRISTLVSDFLFFAKPPKGKPELFDIKAAVGEICELFLKDAHHAENFILKTDLDSDLYVIMDPTHLRQIIWNLLINAAEALNENGLIHVSCAVTKGGEILIKVSDNGCGISENQIQSIFNPFFTTKAAGTGLGLSIIHRILEAYNSRLDVESKVDAGSTFSFFLNRAKSPT